MDCKDELLKVRVPSDLKEDLEDIAETDPQTGDVSKWVRCQLRVALRIAKQKRHTDGPSPRAA